MNAEDRERNFTYTKTLWINDMKAVPNHSSIERLGTALIIPIFETIQ